MNILQTVYNFYNTTALEKGVIGKSVEGRDIIYFFTGSKTQSKIIVQCAIHARESVTALVALKLLEHLAQKDLSYGVYFIPLANPDGTALTISGVESVSSNRRELLLNVNNKNCDFSLFKANANAVDLNTNFDARFGSGVSNLFYPSTANYVGSHAFCQPESAALRDFTLSIKPQATISYHTKGQEIYWYFHQNAKAANRDKKIANAVGKATGYAVKYTFGSAGGYKDWCIEKLKIPALTIEVGSDDLPHPICYRQVDNIFNQNKNVLCQVARFLE